MVEFSLFVFGFSGFVEADDYLLFKPTPKRLRSWATNEVSMDEIKISASWSLTILLTSERHIVLHGNTSLIEGRRGQFCVKTRGNRSDHYGLYEHVGPNEDDTVEIFVQSVALCEELALWLTTDDRVHDSSCYSIKIPYAAKPVQVACSGCFSLILDDRGRVWRVARDSAAIEVCDLPENDQAIQICCGVGHALVLMTSGAVYSIGNNSHGQLGHGGVNPSDQFEEIEALAGIPMVAIACGHWHSVAISSQGDVYTWGWDDKGQLGPGIDGERPRGVPTAVDLPDTVHAISASCGAAHTAVLCSDGKLWGWGWTKYGQLGETEDGINPSSLGDKQIAAPHLIDLDPKTQIVQVVCGPWHTAAVGCIQI